MKKYILFTIFLLSFTTIFSQEMTFKKTTDFEKGIRIIESDCDKDCPEIAPGLRYKLRRTEYAGKVADLRYEIVFKMAVPFQKTLNSDLKVSTEFTDGTVMERSMLENTGFFDGSFTVLIQSKILEKTKKFGVRHMLLYGERKVVYCIKDDKNNYFTKNLENLQKEVFIDEEEE